MSEIVVLSFKIYAFAILISLGVAVMIRLIVGAFGMAQEESSESSEPSQSAEAANQEIPVAAITAAVYAVIGTHRIVRIQRSSRGHDWIVGGRSSHHQSHNIPRRRNEFNRPK